MLGCGRKSAKYLESPIDGRYLCIANLIKTSRHSYWVPKQSSNFVCFANLLVEIEVELIPKLFDCCENVQAISMHFNGTIALRAD